MVVSVLFGLSSLAVTISAPGAWGQTTNTDSLAGTPAWSVRSVAAPASMLNSSLAGVSCPTGPECMAVGGYYSETVHTDLTLAELWNGTKWSVSHTLNPKTAATSFLTAVSCVTASACTAVGYSEIVENQTVTDHPLAEVWNGTRWSIQATPHPDGATKTFLQSVSCSSTSACTAVGYYDLSGSTTAHSLAEAWNGTRWSIQRTPSITSASGGYLQGVSCVSSLACTAVGYSISSVGETTVLVDAWNGTAWSTQDTQATLGVLNSVSCTPTSCVAVGQYNLVEVWNGSTWSAESTPSPSGASYSDLAGISCSSSTVCVAVGYSFTTGNPIPLTLAEVWDGTGWSIQPTPNPTGAQYSYLKSVSCPSASACAAVGDYNNSSGTYLALAEQYS